ncbi:hypothetical protein VTK73DRAFT_7269 [Phialemonium thermophilum]|uniref:Cellular morphogenesis protein n=1 Tax=Phialemonium thermophilum TaxID=223376 RepID=A0ABR3WFN3_9PEZI
MQLPSCRRRGARKRPLALFGSILTASTLLPSSIRAISFTPAPSANIDLSQLGRVAVAGDFSGISLFQFEEQGESSLSANGSQALLARLPNKVFVPVVKTDASIQTMCAFGASNGTVTSVVVGGNFTSLGGQQSAAIGLFNPNTSEITPLPGLSGQVNALLCDDDTDTVYAGGNFVGANSTNAIAWSEKTGFANLPFAGFNGPVTSITKLSNGNIVFGGSFTGLGNATSPSQPDGQLINLSSATITSGSSSTAAGFSDPRNIVCKTSGVDGAGNTWLLQDQTAGFWQASFDFGFRPTKLRLWNTHQEGRGTKTWRFTAFPINGILNFTYIDPATGQNSSCTSQCPLSDDKSVPFQDFHFVNVIGMNEFRIDISDFYGNGGGLNGIELFEDDIFTYAINDFNEPTCAGLPFASTASAVGPWVVSPSLSSTSKYLTAQLSDTATAASASIVFSPDIKESGHYSVNVYTPGCIQDNSCASRGQFVITGQMTADPTKSTPINQTLFQTNNFDKYDQIYFGQIDASSSSFRPSVTMTPLPGQDIPNLTFVAQRVGFTLINSTGGLNGLFEYDPSSSTVNASDFSSSAFNRLGSSFTTGSAVNTLASSGDTTFIGGNFTSNGAKNVVAVRGKDGSTKSLDGGLNGEVLAMYLNGTNLFVAGQFTNTMDRSAQGLNNVAVYDTSKDSWSPLGSGVDGRVSRVVPLTMNITGSIPELVISFGGDFKQLGAFGNNPAIPVDGFGVWVPSQSNWLQNLDLPVERISGTLSSSVVGLSGGIDLYAGSLASSSLRADGAATLGGSPGRLPAEFETSLNSNELKKRDTSSRDVPNGVVTGAFDLNNNRNITILAGHFTASATNGSIIHNLLLINASNSNAVTGLLPGVSDESTFNAVAVQGDVLFAGGNVTGRVNGGEISGLVTFNLAKNEFNSQPPPLTGGNRTVSSITVRPKTADVYVGGSFQSAGSLSCPGVCYFSTASGQWNQPGQNIGGTVNRLLWISDSKLLAGGNLTVNDSSTTFLATYDVSKQMWDSFPGANHLPGPVTAITPASKDSAELWVGGTSPDGSGYIMKYDGSTWNATSPGLGPGTDIRSLQMFSLTSSHHSTPLVDSKHVLVLTGTLLLPNFGAVSAATFNGTSFQPFVLTTTQDNTPGSIAQLFSEKQDFFNSKNGHLALGFIVLIGLGISLVLMLLIVVAGLFLDRLRKKREGYVPAPTSMFDRGSGLQRIPPEELLGNVGKGRPGAPQV